MSYIEALFQHSFFVFLSLFWFEIQLFCFVASLLDQQAQSRYNQAFLQLCCCNLGYIDKLKVLNIYSIIEIDRNLLIQQLTLYYRIHFLLLFSMQKKSSSLKQIRVSRQQPFSLMLHSSKGQTCFEQQADQALKKYKIKDCLSPTAINTKKNLFKPNRYQKPEIQTKNVELIKQTNSRIFKPSNLIKLKQGQVQQCLFHQKIEINITNFQSALEQFHKAQDQSKNYLIKIRCKQLIQ